MEIFTKDFIILLQYLLPGFVAAWIFYGLTSFPIPSKFERIVQALIFTIFVRVFIYLTQTLAFFIGNKYPLFKWSLQADLAWSVIWAILLGIIFSYYTNNDKVHKKLRDWNITKETSYPSEWFGTFSENQTYVVLHLHGERRLYGWIKEWPSDYEKGHFVLVDASWLYDDVKDKKNEQIPLAGVSSIMIAVKDVNMVEFMKKTWEEKNEQKSIQSAAAD